MEKSEHSTVGVIVRTKKQKPAFKVPGLPSLYWSGDSPPEGTEMSVVDFLAWIDERDLKVANRVLIDPAKRRRKDRAKQIDARKQELLDRDPDRYVARQREGKELFDDSDKLHIYGPPTAKQVDLLRRCKYRGAPPKHTVQAAEIIKVLFEQRASYLGTSEDDLYI